MPRSFSDYTEQFFWDFKRMDNVNFNFRIIENLYKARGQSSCNYLFNKPIIILIVSIIECILYDFIIRIHTHRNDPFPNISQSIVAFIRGSNITDELKRIIPRIKSQNLLCVSDNGTLYKDLEYLRNIRNRVHIQNRYRTLDKDELNVFTEKNLKKAEQCLEEVCEVLCNVYPRWNRDPLPIKDFPRPWVE